ncbi:hypothetical protein [Streptomyces sp. NPDC048551]|uniref:hypothetical protein n=1 Tax=Streptomyces sp. NPDC048551 TaxID=3155758 RepID=UPI0034153208
MMPRPFAPPGQGTLFESYSPDVYMLEKQLSDDLTGNDDAAMPFETPEPKGSGNQKDKSVRCAGDAVILARTEAQPEPPARQQRAVHDIVYPMRTSGRVLPVRLVRNPTVGRMGEAGEAGGGVERARA